MTPLFTCGPKMACDCASVSEAVALIIPAGVAVPDVDEGVITSVPAGRPRFEVHRPLRGHNGLAVA